VSSLLCRQLLFSYGGGRESGEGLGEAEWGRGRGEEGKGG